MLTEPEAPAPDPDRLSHLDEEQPLDDAVSRTVDAGARWKWAAIAPTVAVLVLSVLIPVFVVLAGLPGTGDVVAGYGLALQLALGAVIVAVARPLVRRHGGWRQAFGLGTPLRADGGRVFRWLLLQLAVRVAIGVVFQLLAPKLPPGDNLSGAGDLGPLGATLLLASAVLVAPVVEELAFRGLLLRALMRRLSFWPAALISSGVFGLLHIPGASTVGGMLQLVVSITAFGTLQCLLVRRTGRLAPAIGVHAVLNLLVTSLALGAA